MIHSPVIETVRVKESHPYQGLEGHGTAVIGSIVLGSGEPHPVIITWLPRTEVSPNTSVPWNAAASTSAVPGIGAWPLVHITPSSRSPTALAEIKRVTGWSWDRIARILGCTRQAVHGWILGREVNAVNAERIARLRATLAFVSRETSENTRELLDAPTGDGRIVADLLADQEFSKVRELLGAGSGMRDVTPWTRLSEQVEPGRDTHWFDRLADTQGVGIPLEIVPSPGEKRRIVVRRKG
jgi:hypothetical protein